MLFSKKKGTRFLPIAEVIKGSKNHRLERLQRFFLKHVDTLLTKEHKYGVNVREDLFEHTERPYTFTLTTFKTRFHV